MKKLLIAVCAALGLVSACSRPEPVLHVYNWSDYIKPELVARFEREQRCRVVMDFYDSNEVMYAKLKAGASGYDLVVPTSYMVSIMHQQGMLLPIDHARIPNIRHIDPAYLGFTSDPAMHHSVPYMVGNTGIGYLESRVPDFAPTWGIFGNPAYAGRMTLLNDMREVIGAALKYLGYSLNTTDGSQLLEARDVVIGWKRNIAKFESDQYKNGLVSAEFLMSHGYNGDVMQVMEENEDIRYAVPQEGTSLASDDMVILKDAKQVELAHAFIDFLHDPQVAAENTDYVWYLCPNMAAYPLIGEEVRNDPSVNLPPELLAKCEVIRDLGEENQKYVRIWDQIKAAE